jgi:tRNA dimethylallyltransferase
MVTAGFMAEVQALRARGDLHLGQPSMRCVGYRQAWLALDQGDAADFQPAALAATRQLAKRQLTWLRSIPERRVVACDAPAAPSTAVQQLIHAIDCVAPNLL